MDDLKIRQKCEDMLVYGYTAIRQFPKAERHVLAQELRLTMWAVLRLIIIRDVRPMIAAWCGYAGHANTRHLQGAVVGSATFVRHP